MAARNFLAALILFVLVGFLGGCGSVHVTKTAKGSYDRTDPKKVEVLLTRPERPYEELGRVKVSGFGTSGADTEKMYNAIRAKVAPLGANAVILTDQGTIVGYMAVDMWAQGVAIRYRTEGKQK